MTAPRTLSRLVIGALLGLGAINSFCSTASAEESESDRVLDLFFQLGLPDTRGAKWVTAHRQFSYGDSQLAIAGTVLTGNAWLISERADGTVELVTCFGQRSVYRRLQPDRAPEKSTLPYATIQPADLDADLKKLKDALTKDPTHTTELGAVSGDFINDDGTPDFSALQDRTAQPGQPDGRALLFLAQLKRNGQQAQAQELYEALTKRFSSREAALSSAVSSIASARLSGLNREWCEKGDRDAYITGLERLTENFPRGWNNREAVIRLIQRLRSSQPAPEATTPDALAAARLLLGLKREDLQKLPRGQNWLLPGNHETDRFADLSTLVDAADGSEDSDSDAPEAEHAKPKTEGPLTAFFAKPREAAAALARLVNDGRFLRLMRNEFSGSQYYGSSDGESDEARITQRYQQIHRPIELGELAWQLLEPLLPNSERMSIGDGDRSATISAWLQRIAKQSDEELAWEAMRSAHGPYEPAFQNGLNYLVAHGGDSTIKKLREVFLDPAVWSQNVDSALPALEAYLKRINDDAASFMAQLKPVVTKALNSQGESMHFNGPGAEEMKKQMATQAAAQLKRFDQVLKPSKLSDLLGELDTASDDDAEAAMQTIQQAFMKTPTSEAQALVLQAAARITKPIIRQQLVGMLYQASFQRRHANSEPIKTANIFDDTTRGAICKLLEDESEISSPYSVGRSQTIAALTSGLIVWPSIGRNEQQDWTSLAQKVPHLFPAWLKQRARALVEGKEPPPRPDASRVTPERLQTLITEWSSLEPAKLLAQFHAASPDEQLAVSEYLTKTNEWPPAFRAAQLSITKVSGDLAKKLGADAWKCRSFDEALEGETSAIVEKAALEQTISLEVTSEGPLSGLSVSATSSPELINPGQLKETGVPGLEKRPIPTAMVYRLLQMGSMSNPQDRDYFGYPVWKDANLGKAWREESVKEVGEPTAPDPSQRQTPVDSRHFQKSRKALLEAKSFKTPFTLSWSSILVKADERSEKFER